MEKVITTTKVVFRDSQLSLAPHDYTLIAISLISITGYVIFLVLKRRKLHNLPDQMMLALLITLFGGLVCFALIAVPAGRDSIGCRMLAAVTQFLFLSSLTWSNSIAISITRSLFTMRLISKSKKSIIIYTMYSLGFPLLCVLITFGLSTVDIATFNAPVYRNRPVCFLHEQITMYTLFLVPIYLLIGANIILGMLVIAKVAGSGRIGSTKDKNKLKKNVITCFKISCSLGLGWVFLFAATFYDPLFDVFQVFIEIQGLLVVLANVVGWKCLNKVKSLSASKTPTSIEASGERLTNPTNLSMSSLDLR